MQRLLQCRQHDVAEVIETHAAPRTVPLRSLACLVPVLDQQGAEELMPLPREP